MRTIERVRPQSKRKALRAAFFVDRYSRGLQDAVDRGDEIEAAKMRSKLAHWQPRRDRYIGIWL